MDRPFFLFYLARRDQNRPDETRKENKPKKQKAKGFSDADGKKAVKEKNKIKKKGKEAAETRKKTRRTAEAGAPTKEKKRGQKNAGRQQTKAA